MGKTILELFKGSPQDKSVKAERETFLEQETSGIRISSLVEVNNPLIYGNEATRIALRSTPLLEDIKSNANGGTAGGGLIGGKINQARDFVNSTIGIPEAQTPSRLVDKIDGTASNDNPSKSMQKRLDRFAEKNPNQVKNPHSQIPITKDIVGSNGTEVGKFLKQSGGGNPKTIGKQALGSGIGVAKDKLRGELFGEGQNAGTAQSSGGLNGKTYSVEYTSNDSTYSDTNNSKKLIKTKEELEKTKLNLSLVSPLYGTKRKSNPQTSEVAGRFGKSEYAYEDIRYSYRQPTPYDPTRTYTRNEDGQLNGIVDNSLTEKYGMSNGSDSINLLGSGDYDSLDEYGRALNSSGEIIGEDLVPFNIGKYGKKKTPFRSIITGISETVSPGWNTNKMLGNPFSFYTYTGVERSVTFVLKIVCYSPLELATNWEKMETLTKMAYPSITKSNLVNPPVIEFRLGDMYYDKVGFIESLTNTIPDNSTWETDGELGYLPKFIDCSITIKFIEDTSVLNSLYGYKKSKAAIDKINEENDTKGYNSDSLVSDRAGNGDATLSSRFNIDNPKPIKVNARGITQVGNTDTIKPNMSGLAKLGTGGSVITPQATEEGTSPTIKSQSSISDKLGGKTPLEVINEKQNSGLTEKQARNLASFKVQGYKEISKQEVLSQYPDSKTLLREDTGQSIFVKREQFGKYDIYQIPSDFGIARRIEGGLV